MGPMNKVEPWAFNERDHQYREHDIAYGKQGYFGGEADQRLLHNTTTLYKQGKNHWSDGVSQTIFRAIEGFKYAGPADTGMGGIGTILRAARQELDRRKAIEDPRIVYNDRPPKDLRRGELSSDYFARKSRENAPHKHGEEQEILQLEDEETAQPRKYRKEREDGEKLLQQLNDTYVYTEPLRLKRRKKRRLVKL